MKPPSDLDTILEDIKVLGRREFSHLLRLRHKYQLMLTREQHAKDKQAREEAKALEGPVDDDALIDAELEKTISRIEREKKR